MNWWNGWVCLGSSSLGSSSSSDRMVIYAQSEQLMTSMASMPLLGNVKSSAQLMW